MAQQRTQDLIFKKTEGDNYYKRNREKLLFFDLKKDWPLQLLKKLNFKPEKVLEVGASNGWRAAAIERIYGSKCVAIDPSKKAISEGKKIYPKISFHRGLMSNLPIKKNETFDMVIVSLVFHWIDRTTLMQSIAEIDRVLKNGGYLIISDFFPDKPITVPYHHLPNKKIFTYKLDYANIFLSTNLYRIIDRVIFDHNDWLQKSKILSKERAHCTVLRKVL